MAINGQWTIACIVVNGSTQIFGLRDKSHDSKLREMHESGSGDPFPTFAGIMEGAPVVSFSSTAVASTLQSLGATPFPIDGGTVDIYYQRYLQGGLRDTSGAVKFHYTKGMFVPQKISASQKGSASINYDFIGCSIDGETQPFTYTTGESLPAITPVNESFTLGPVSINGATFQGVQKTDVDFGYKPKVDHSDGQAWPTFCGIESLLPKVTFSGLDLAAIDTFTNTAIAVTSWSTYFRAIQSGGLRAPTSSGVHVKVGGTAGMLKSERTTGSHGRESDASWCIYPTRDPNNPAFIVDPSSAIGL